MTPCQTPAAALLSRSPLGGWRRGLGILVVTLAAGGAQAHVPELLGPVSVPDSQGRTVSLAQPAHRVVSLAPHATELVAAAGGQATLVGVIHGSDYPPVARLIPRVGDAWQIDRERVAALRPDLVIAWLEPAVANLQPLLQALNAPVFFSAPTALAQIPEQIEALGQLLGTPTPAQHTAAHWRRQLADLQAASASRPAQRVFIEVGRAPLYTLNHEHIVNDVLTVCGASNVFADAPVVAPPVSVEAVLAAQPDAIVVAAQPNAANRLAAQNAWQPYAVALPAAANPILIDPDLLVRPGPRLLEGATALCKALESAAG